MTRSILRNSKRKTLALNTLKEKGFLACALGLCLLLIPMLFSKSSAMTGLVTALRPAGWASIALGGMLLGLHHFAKTRQASSEKQRDSSEKNTGISTRRNRKAQIAATEPIEPQWVGSGHKPNLPTAQPPASPDVGSARQPATEWSEEVFSRIEWRRFEAVCEALFAQAGFETRSQSHGADGGVDIWLHSRNSSASGTPVAVVQCKHWQGRPVGVKEMREFFGVMASHQLQRGTYATTSQYTPDAQVFAKANGINALDRAGLLKLIAKRTPEQQQALLAVAFEGDYGRPTCASCGVKMVKRTPSKGGANFWGCSAYPRCKSRLPMAAAVR